VIDQVELGHEVIVAHARNVRLIGESRRKDDRLDARTLARLARIDPQLLSPVKHRSEPQMHISKEGDPYLRTLLVQGAHHILGPFGADSDLRRWGLKLAERGGTNGKKRAIIATARKLAVLLHRLWVSGEVYEPLRNTKRTRLAAA
jgi:transposase